MNKLTDPIIYFVHLGDVESVNNSKRMAPAIRCGYPFQFENDPNEYQNIFAFTVQVPGPYQNLERATTLTRALQGFCWATIEDAESWGIDLTDFDQDITLL